MCIGPYIDVSASEFGSLVRQHPDAALPQDLKGNPGDELTPVK